MTALAALATTLTGSLVEPHHDTYLAAAQPWNRAIEQRPLAVVNAQSVDDVAATVRWARDHGVRILTQPTGHAATDAGHDAVLLRTIGLGGVHVDPAGRTARVGAGVTWGAVLEATTTFGLAAPAGSSPVINVTGYLLGGGLSWLSRQHGWAANSVRAFEIVDADGAARRVGADQDPELFWALRGGGGGFGIVTALEIDLQPVTLYGGRMLWPLERAGDVLAAYRQITTDAPDELTVWIDMLRIPGTPPMIAADCLYLGPPVPARALLAPLDAVPGPVLSDGRDVIAPADISSITMEPTEPTPFVARTELLTGLDETTIDALTTIPSAALLSVRLRHLGGALARPTETAPGPLTEPYLLYLLGDPSYAEPTAIGQSITNVLDAVTDKISGRRPFTYLSAKDTASAAFPPEALEQLRKIRVQRDPNRIFKPAFDVLS